VLSGPHLERAGLQHLGQCDLHEQSGCLPRLC
jgi:hypothetical protein